MAYKITLFRAATEDFTEAEDWYQTRSPQTATRFVTAYLRIARSVADNPQQFAVIYGEHVRRARFGNRFPYSLIFFVRDDTVYIASVFHDKRNPASWKKRV